MPGMQPVSHLPLDVYRRCYGAYTQGAQLPLKRRAKNAEHHIETMSAYYLEAARAGALHLIATHSALDEMSPQDMGKLYAGQFSAAHGACRDVYDEIRSLAPHGICPLCLQRAVSQVDHYLPKAHYPAFAVDPRNLVPVCTDCNWEKGEAVISKANERVVHPYFDVLPDIWLQCNLEQSERIVASFSVSSGVSEETGQKDLLESHLRELNLDSFYKIHAGKRLYEIGSRLRSLHGKGSSDYVRAQLQDNLEEAERFNRNSWQSALFRALSQSDWFCRDGFNLIP